MTDIQIITHPTVRLPAGYAAEDGVELWAIGDVHGQANELEALIDLIESIPEDRSREIIQTGDVIDRGDHSLRAIDALIRVGAVGLLGNHEQLALLAAQTREERWHRQGHYSLWLDNGGTDVLRDGLGEDWSYQQHPSRIPQAFGIRRWDYVRTLRNYHRSGNLIFVHAGLDPERRLHDVLDEPWDVISGRHRTWIREPFLRANSHHGLFVIHGHTPNDNFYRQEDEFARNRVNLDLGSYASGGVRAARIIGSEVTLYDAWGPVPRGYDQFATAIRRGRI